MSLWAFGVIGDGMVYVGKVELDICMIHVATTKALFRILRVCVSFEGVGLPISDTLIASATNMQSVERPHTISFGTYS
jgi:hypothetical protein